jgi:4-hydroxybenzoate polyprenyltransferase/phosphoserine phosphatase
MLSGMSVESSAAAAATSDPSSDFFSAAHKPRRVVVVDLDGTLLKSDILHEQLIRLLLRQPLSLVGFLKALGTGKAEAKAYCAERIPLDIGALPFCSEVLDVLRRERAQGSYLVLCTAADRRAAEAVAQDCGLFDEVIATENGVNLKGTTKAAALAKRFPEGFVYIGDHADDLPVWAQAKEVVLAGARPRTARQARALNVPVTTSVRERPSGTDALRQWVRALRVAHWPKNLLIFVPLVLAHQWQDFQLIGLTIAGFAALAAVTSCCYLLNDLIDLDIDRRHLTKRERPLASGALPLVAAAALVAIVLPGVLAASLLVYWPFGLALASYAGLTIAYSLWLKRIPLLDTLVIALLFTLRLMMGAVLIRAELPIWLMTFSVFFFFSLAMTKRYAEIVRALRIGGDSLKARGYEPEDGPLALGLGLAAGLGSLIVLLLYMVNEAFRKVGYTRPAFLWLIVLIVAVWIGRLWLLTHRGRMHDDPVDFTLRDRPSLGLAAAAAVCFLIAL